MLYVVCGVCVWRVCVVCVFVHALDTEGNWAVTSRALEVVQTGLFVSDRLQWLSDQFSWITFATL